MGLRQKSITGFFWTASGTLGNGVISLLVTMILARLLTPYDFAIIELLVIFIAVANVFVDSGFSQAIIRDKNPSDIDLSSVFYFNMVLSLLIYIILFFVAPFISKFFASPELVILSRVVFLIIIFNSLTIIQNATLYRSLDFKSVSKASLAGTFIAGIIAVIMAFTGFGVWSIVANMVLMPLFRSIFFWSFSKWKPLFRFSFSSIKRYFNFSFFLMVQGFLDAIVSNIISLFIGKVYTKNDLGFFSQGRKLDGYIVLPAASILHKVTYPILSKIKQDEKRLKEGYRQIIGITMALFVPTLFFVMIAAEEIMFTFFGEKWIDAGVYLKIFAMGGLFYPLQKICMNIVFIKGKTKTMLKLAIIKQTLRVIFILVLVKVSVVALAFGFVISGIIGSILFIILGMKYINYSLKEFILDLYQIILSASISIIVVYLSKLFMPEIHNMIALVIYGGVMSIVYLMIINRLNNPYFKEICIIMKNTIAKLRIYSKKREY